MKQFLAISLLGLCLLLPGQGWGAQLASDDFNRADSGLGANWTTVTTGGNPTILSNEVRDTSVGGATSLAVYSAITWPDDQYAQIKVVAATSNTRSVGLILRGATAARTDYECQVIGPLGATTTLTIYRLVAGAATALVGGTAVYTVAAGDTAYCEIRGYDLTMKINGVTQLGPFTDTDVTKVASGSAGIEVNAGTGAVTDALLDNFAGGDFATTCRGGLMLLGVGGC